MATAAYFTTLGKAPPAANFAAELFSGPTPKLLAQNAYISMIETAKNVAERYGVCIGSGQGVAAVLENPRAS